jgi:predicted TPR repeat methyltransferase
MMNGNILPRFDKVVDLIKRFNIRAYTFLDLGCGDGIHGDSKNCWS